MIDPRRPDYSNTPISPRRPRFGYSRSGGGGETRGADQRPVVTVVTPFFNTGEVFRETAACVLGQSLHAIEWLIINDGSKDRESLAMLEEFRRHPDPRIRVIDHRLNRGLSAARNTGFRAAAAELIFQFDSDDLIEPTTLEKCALFLETHPEFAFVKGRSVGFGALSYLWDKGFHSESLFLEENMATATAMVRRCVHEDVGGYDETITGGLEDWEFWLRCAAFGHWGTTIPEFLDWYRRRLTQHAEWENLARRENIARFRTRLEAEYPGLYNEGFPCVRTRAAPPYSDPPETIPFENRHAKAPGQRRLLMIVPWFRMGGADKFNLDLVRYLTSMHHEPWEVTLAATIDGGEWLADFTALTPDVFVLPSLGRPTDAPRLLRHLIESRSPDVVMVTNSELGYQLLPFLRRHCPGPAYVDLNHMEEEHWNSGGHPRSGVGMQDLLDLNITVSGHLKRWMAARGAEAGRIEVCHINADTGRFRPDPAARERVRRALGIPDDQVVILYAARLCPQKQPRVFAETMRLLAGRFLDPDERGPRAPFVGLVAGNGEDEAWLRDELARRRLLTRVFESDEDDTDADERSEESADAAGGEVKGWPAPHGEGWVRMLGPIAADRMPALMAAADIFFLPSQWEGIALTIYEAMSAGLAVVGAEVGGQAELVVPGTGVLLPRPSEDEREACPDAEAAAYADALERLVVDSELRARLGQAARDRITRGFELRHMGERIVGLFERAQEFKHTHPRTPLSPGLTRELTVQALESLRAHRAVEEFEPLCRWRQEMHHREHEERTRAAASLAMIENSRTWRLVQAVKATAAYRVLARARYGAHWHLVDPKEDPRAKLARIRSSRAYRMIAAMKRVPPYPLYTRLRYGSNA